MEPRNIFWKKQITIPNTVWTIKGYSRAAFRTGFYIKELDIMLDAGPQLFKIPDHIFITHTHADHIANLPLTLCDEVRKIPQIYGPSESETKLMNYVKSLFAVNSPLSPFEYDNLYLYNPISNFTEFFINANKSNIYVRTFNCDHSVPTVSYGFSLVKRKLKEELKTKTKEELIQYKKEGHELTMQVFEHNFAYICDTSIKVLFDNPFIFEYKTIFIECTFIYPDEIDNAKKTKHIHWNQLISFVKEYENITFILFHFSLRYKDEEIKAFFDNEFIINSISNVQLWLSDL
jgi:ribonuclease Z